MAANRMPDLDLGELKFKGCLDSSNSTEESGTGTETPTRSEIKVYSSFALNPHCMNRDEFLPALRRWR